jgi:hypothetical protein
MNGGGKMIHYVVTVVLCEIHVVLASGLDPVRGEPVMSMKGFHP